MQFVHCFVISIIHHLFHNEKILKYQRKDNLFPREYDHIRTPFFALLMTGISESSISSICLQAYFLVSPAMTPERRRTAIMLGIVIRPFKISAIFHIIPSSAMEPTKIPHIQMILYFIIAFSPKRYTAHRSP